jgi:hypothetical protein
MTKINSDSKDSNNQMNCYELIKMFNQLLVLWKPAGCDDDDNGLAAVHSLCRLAIIISRSVCGLQWSSSQLMMQLDSVSKLDVFMLGVND